MDGGLPGDAGEAPTCEVRWPGLRIGTAADDAVNALAIGPNGRVWIGGYVGGQVGQGNLEPLGNADGFARQYELDGTPVSAVTFATDASDVVEDVLPLVDGRALVLGRTMGQLTAAPRGGQYDAFLAVVSPSSPDALQIVQGGLQTPQHPHRLILGDGVVTAVGYDDLYIPTNYVEAWPNPLVARSVWDGQSFGPATLEVWSSPEEDWVRDGVAVGDGSGDLIVAYHSAGGPRRGAGAVRFGADGTERWRARISAAGLDVATSVVALSDGRVAVLGATIAPLGPGGQGGQDGFIAAVDVATGAIIETTLFGTPYGDYPTAAVLGPDGLLYVAGESLGTFSEDRAPAQGTAAFVVALDDTWQVRAAWSRDPPGYDHATSVAVDDCGRVLVAGLTNGEMVPGQPHAGGQDGFVVQADLREWSGE